MWGKGGRVGRGRGGRRGWVGRGEVEARGEMRVGTGAWRGRGCGVWRSV